MVYLGLVGAESPMGKMINHLLDNHRDECKIVFKVDTSYQKSHQDSLFPDVDEALIMIPATMIIDCKGHDGAYDRVKTYLWHHVPAVMCAVDFSQDELDALTALRRAGQKSVPTLVIEHELSWSSILLTEQVLSGIKAFATEVTGVYIKVFNACQNSQARILPLMQKINKILGVNERGLQLKQSKSSCSLGLVEVEFIGHSANDHPAGEHRTVEVCLSKGDSADVTSLIWNFNNNVLDFWSGLRKVLDFLQGCSESSEARIWVDILPQTLRRCW